MSLELRVTDLEKQVKGLKKRAASFKRPSGPEEIAMRLAALPNGHLVDAAEFFYHYESVGWKKANSRVTNLDALLMSWAHRATKKPTSSAPSAQELYG